MAVAGLLVIVTMRQMGNPSGTTPAAGVAVDAAAPGAVVVSSDADPSLSLIADLTADLDWESATAVGLGATTGALDAAVALLNEAERGALHEMLQAALSGKGA
jgi:hypothetical protein